MNLDWKRKFLEFPSQLITKELLAEAYKYMMDAALIKAREIGPGNQRSPEHLTTGLTGFTGFYSAIVKENQEGRSLGKLIQFVEAVTQPSDQWSDFAPVTEIGVAALKEFFCSRYDEYIRQQGKGV